MTPHVSVLMPVFNAAETLPFALASLRSQTFEDWECVLVDDGSTDNPGRIVEIINEPRIRLRRLSQNMGRGHARRATLEMARGKYIAMLDADDWIYPQKLERQLDLIERDPTLAVVSSSMAITNRKAELTGIRSPRTADPVFYGSMDRVGMPPLAFGPCLMSSELAKHTGFNTAFARAQDSDFLLRALLGKRYAVLCDPLYTYREQGCLSLAKVIPSLSYCCQMFAQYKKRYPVRSRALIATSQLKKLAYYAADTVDLWDAIIKRRSRPPTVGERRQHDVAYDRVLATCARLFTTDVRHEIPERKIRLSPIRN